MADAAAVLVVATGAVIARGVAGEIETERVAFGVREGGSMKASRDAGLPGECRDGKHLVLPIGREEMCRTAAEVPSVHALEQSGGFEKPKAEDRAHRKNTAALSVYVRDAQHSKIAGDGVQREDRLTNVTAGA